MIRPKLNWRINFQWFKIITLSIMPGVLTSFLLHDFIWLIASFLTVSGVIPYITSHGNRSFAIVSMVIICILAFLTKFLIIHQLWAILLVFLVILGLVCGIIDNLHSQLYSLSAWLIIGTIYGGIKLVKINISAMELISIISFALLGVVFVALIIDSNVERMKFHVLDVYHPEFWFNFKFVLPILCSGLLWYYANIREPEWMMWASLSVVNIDKKILLEKFQIQVIGVVSGVLLGALVSFILPIHSDVFTYICFVFIMLGLKIFDDLFTGYLFRSFFVVLYAGIKSFDIAIIRGSNVVIGGIIGVVCTYLLITLHGYIFQTVDNC